MSDNAVIVFKAVHKSYITDFKRNKKKAIADLSFQVHPGEVFGIVGPNGAGKSTAMKILMGFVKHDSGHVRLSGQSPSSPEAHRQLGYLPENPCLYENLTIREQLQFAGRVARYSAGEIASRTDKVLELVDLTHAEKTPIRSYSKGMTQRAALAYALLHEPETLILDEPMSGLDPVGRQLVVDIIRDYNQKGNTILFCSHVLTDVERICARIGLMNKGRLAAIITPDELKKAPPPSGEKTDTSPLEAFFIKTIAADK